ncbi:hypothetical protein ACQJ22_17885 [Pseudomonas fragariae (ex Marin et al. 2024)]|uniref:hypothetical protein n=1 Tax=Pseudomonas TaxID=286 RepID=UPI0004507BE5|nr:hypothetical protein [Pseudomonas syringae]AKF43656.1 hypothetical protein PsyrB_00515 [Pseudomonas syringae pv. syringae B301D]EXL29158.1 hypothetical protein PssB301D_04655 [Pseudomonas syringae pv. syringae str. B301D-R]
MNSSSTDTLRRLAEMTDPAAFERVAAAVLRAAKPSIYENMAHPGVQPGGKTIKAPFDNVGWLSLPDGNSRLVCAAHTTEQKDLVGKWLHDPSSVKPRKPGKKPTKPAGDLIKGIAEIEKLRADNPDLAVTFALTANTETSLELRVAVEKMAAASGVELDIWSVSRIAHFLDTDPTGQFIRQIHLGAPVELLSRDSLLKIGSQSIQDHTQENVRQESIHREDFVLTQGDYLVVGDSGMGKTTACLAALSARIDSGTPAIVIRTESVVMAVTIEAALDSELRRHEPSLEHGSGERALALCATDEPLMILFEDINRSTSPALLLNKILRWCLPSTTEGDVGRSWRAVCPIWPRYLNVIQDQTGTLAVLTILRIDKYSQAEATMAVMKRAQVLKLSMDQGRATEIAYQLGCDPLLIGLHNLRSEAPASAVITSYIDQRIGIVANEDRYTKTEVREALHLLIRRALQQRRLNPSWTEARSWIGDRDTIEVLRSLMHEGSVIRISQSSPDELIEFRHDRVMHSLLSGSLAEDLKTKLQPDYIIDPFFAEMVGGGAVQAEVPLENLVSLMESSPAIGAHALKISSEERSSYEYIAAQALAAWLQRQDAAKTSITNRKYIVARILAETTSKYTQNLVTGFSEDERALWAPLLEALFRNGNILAGLSLLSRYDLGVTVAGKQSLLSLVKRLYGERLISAVDAALRNPDLDQWAQQGHRTGALRLAGYIGSSALAQSIRLCWEQDDSTTRDLRSYLFAAARCCGGEDEATLGPVCDAWECLPDEPDAKYGQPVERLAADGVDWEFGNYIPQDAISYFVNRANSSEKLRWPITYMLRSIDHPAALEHIVRYAASSYFITADTLRRSWKQDYKKPARQMSLISRNHLLQIASDKTESVEVREQAFSFWELLLSTSDLPVIRQIPENDPLFERALWARARRGDYSVIPQVLPKISENPEHWLGIGHYVWSSAMTDMLDSVLSLLANEKSNGWSNLEYAVADALMRVESARRISMLSSRWSKLKSMPLMVQTALLSTDHGAVELIHEAFETAQNPSSLLRYFASSASYIDGKRNLSTRSQMFNLIPYLKFFSDDEIQELWDVCTKKGWLDFRSQHIEPRVRQIPNRFVCLSEDPVDTSDLDKALAARNGLTVSIYRWFERPHRNGIARQKVFAALLQWLSEHSQDKAMRICAEIVSSECTRSEFLLFEAAIAGRPDASSITEAVRFNVFNRILV